MAWGKIKMTIRKRGEVWEYRFSITTDGERRQFSKSGFRTKKECQLEGLKALAYYENGAIDTKFESISFNRLFEIWYASMSPNWKQTTAQLYKGIYERNLKEEFGFLKVKSITPLKIQEFVNKTYSENSPQYAKLVKIVLSSAFKYAVLPLGIIPSSPCEYVKTPRTEPRIKSETVSIEKIKEALTNIPEPYSLAILVSFYSGMRLGEVFGLCWEDIDSDNKIINVNKTMSYSSSNWHLTTPKTKTSIRKIPVPKILFDYLEGYKKNLLSNKMKYGEYFMENYVNDSIVNTESGEKVDLVFREENGKFAKPDLMQYFCRRNGFRFHALRHTHATKLIADGINPKIVQERLGHSTVSITLQIYVHPDEKSHREAAEKFEKIAF